MQPLIATWAQALTHNFFLFSLKNVHYSYHFMSVLFFALKGLFVSL